MPLDTDLEADQRGARRRQADFVLLTHLERNGATASGTLDQEIEAVHRSLQRDGFSPFSFRTVGSTGPTSQELNQAIDRCLHFDRIDLTIDKEYAITERGIAYLESAETLRRHGIDPSFEQAVDQASRDP